MIYTSAGEKSLKIKKDKFISCFNKLPDGGSIAGYVTFKKKYLLSGEEASSLSENGFIQVENTNYIVKNRKGCTKKDNWLYRNRCSRQAGHAPTLQQQVLVITYMPRATSLTQSFTPDHTVVCSILL